MFRISLIKNYACSITALFFLAQPVSATAFDLAALNAIYSQPSFGTNPIDIRVFQEVEIVAPNLVDIRFSPDAFNNPFPVHDEMVELFALGTDGPALDLFFVDSIFKNLGGFTALGFAEFTQTGLPTSPDEYPPGIFGNGMAVIKDLAGIGFEPADIIAHEMGHVLGLHHVGIDRFGFPIQGAINLMTPSPTGDTLTLNQISSIFLSDWVQGDASNGFFIEIQPYDIVSVASPSAIPLPAALPLLASGLSIFGVLGWRRKKIKFETL